MAKLQLERGLYLQGKRRKHNSIPLNISMEEKTTEMDIQKHEPEQVEKTDGLVIELADSNTIEPDYPDHRRTPMYILLGCSILLVLIGGYLTITNDVAVGISDHDAFAQGGGGIAVLSGPFTLLVGFVFSIFPLFHLIKQHVKNKKG